jgi:P-type E1-E2 ATPase
MSFVNFSLLNKFKILFTLLNFDRFKNEASFQELQRKASQVKCNVFRNGKDLQQIPIDEIVVKDSILLESGCIVPADGFILSGSLMVRDIFTFGHILLCLFML